MTLQKNNQAVVHYFVIKVMDRKPGNIIEFLSWSGLRWELRLKYDWYFKYRAALLQVKYPRFHVECWWGNEPATGKTREQLIENKIQAKRRKISQFKNNIEKAKASWDKLFPIEHDPDYIKAIEKINQLENDLCLLIN